MEWWQKYSPYLINIAVVITGVLVWRAYKKVQSNAQDWKTFAQRHAYEHIDDSAYGTVKGQVRDLAFELKQEMSETYDTRASEKQKRDYDRDNHSIERMSFTLPSAPISLKIFPATSPKVQMMKKFAELKGDVIPTVATGNQLFDQRFTLFSAPAEIEAVKNWLNSKRQSALLAYSGPNLAYLSFLTQRLAVTPPEGFGDLSALEKQFQALSELAQSLQ